MNTNGYLNKISINSYHSNNIVIIIREKISIYENFLLGLLQFQDFGKKKISATHLPKLQRSLSHLHQGWNLQVFLTFFVLNNDEDDKNGLLVQAKTTFLVEP